VRAHAAEWQIDPDFFKSTELHVHVPSGAIPKDGPSAGVTMVTAMVSELTRRPVRSGLSMTGEITLQGKVLPVGGIKEKVLAAKRLGIKEVILPRQNEKDVKEDLGEELRKGLTIHLVSTIDEVLLLALVHQNDRPAKKQADKAAASARKTKAAARHPHRAR
jgi:ATP-dependent Lon protease